MNVWLTEPMDTVVAGRDVAGVKVERDAVFAVEVLHRWQQDLGGGFEAGDLE
jgi:hypothetical protein